VLSYTPNTRQTALERAMSDKWDRLDEIVADDQSRGSAGQRRTDDVHSRVELAELSCRNSIAAVYMPVFDDLCQNLERKGYRATSNGQVAPGGRVEVSMTIWRTTNKAGQGIGTITFTCVAGQLVPTVLIEQPNGGYAAASYSLPVTPQNVHGWLEGAVDEILKRAR
jgi:hypothetical protein